MKHSEIVFGLFGPPDEQVAKAVEPRVRALHYPAAGFLARFLRFLFFSARTDVGRIAPFGHEFAHLLIIVAGVQAQMGLLAGRPMGLLGRFGRRRQARQRTLGQLHIMPIGPVEHQPDGHPLRFDQ